MTGARRGITLVPATISWKIAEWRATADEDENYCFAIVL